MEGSRLFIYADDVLPSWEKNIMSERDDFSLEEDAEAEFYKQLEKIKVLTLSKWEALFLSDNVTLLLEHEPEKGKLQIPARGIQSSASVSVPIEMISRIGLAVLLATNPTNKTGMTDMPLTISELYLLREIELLGKLTEEQSKRYLEIVEMCQKNNIEIPFGIEV